MDYKKGDRVKHPTRADWGLGEVLEDNIGSELRVFFTGVGEKRLSLKYIQPPKVQGKDAHDAMLDSLGRRGTEALQQEIRAAHQETTANTVSQADLATTVEEADPENLDWDDTAPDYDDDNEAYEEDFDSDDL